MKGFKPVNSEPIAKILCLGSFCYWLFLCYFVKEVSVVIVRNEKEIVYYPVSENYHKYSLLIQSKIPADITEEVVNNIHQIGKKIVEQFEDYGVFCIEFFVDDKNKINP